MKKRLPKSPLERTKLPQKTRTTVLIQAGYRCAVPICRFILALEMHHIWEVAAGGSDAPDNLVALCRNCHGLRHKGVISEEAIHTYKAMLVAISRAFDLEAVDRLLFLAKLPEPLLVSGDGLVQFARLIAAGLAEPLPHGAGGGFYHRVGLSVRGKQLVRAWQEGSRDQMTQALGDPNSWAD